MAVGTQQAEVPEDLVPRIPVDVIELQRRGLTPPRVEVRRSRSVRRGAPQQPVASAAEPNRPGRSIPGRAPARVAPTCGPARHPATMPGREGCRRRDRVPGCVHGPVDERSRSWGRGQGTEQPRRSTAPPPGLCAGPRRRSARACVGRERDLVARRPAPSATCRDPTARCDPASCARRCHRPRARGTRTLRGGCVRIAPPHATAGRSTSVARRRVPADGRCPKRGSDSVRALNEGCRRWSRAPGGDRHRSTTWRRAGRRGGRRRSTFVGVPCRSCL